MQTTVKKWYRDKDSGFLDNGGGPDIMVQNGVVQTSGVELLTNGSKFSIVGHSGVWHTVLEFGIYAWKKTTTGYKDIPIDKDNHGMDDVRYFIAYIDDIGNIAEDTKEHYVEIVQEVNYSNIM